MQNGSTRERVATILAKPKRKTTTVLSCLIQVQNELGYLPPETFGEVARITGATTNDVWGVATFYSHFRLAPPKRHTVEVCWGPSCYLCGADQVMHAVMDELGVKADGDSPDGAFSFRRNSCAAACANGPVMIVDERHLGRMTPDSARKTIKELRTK